MRTPRTVKRLKVDIRRERILTEAEQLALLPACPKKLSRIFVNPRTDEAYTVNGVAHVFRRALVRAGIASGDVTLHTLRHTALSRMIAMGIDDHTVMAISGHSSTRMLERYTHRRPLESSTRSNLTCPMGRIWAEQKMRM